MSATPRKTLHLTLGPHLKPFEDLCKENETSAQAALRQFVAERLAANHITVKGIPFGARADRPERIELQLHATEMDALRDFALRENIAPTVWMIQRLQDAMAVETGASIGREELRHMAEALDRLQRDMVGMAINLNQVARKVNSRLAPNETIPEARLLVLKEIEKEMKGFVRRGQAVLERLENPRQHPALDA